MKTNNKKNQTQTFWEKKSFLLQTEITSKYGWKENTHAWHKGELPTENSENCGYTVAKPTQSEFGMLFLGL